MAPEPKKAPKKAPKIIISSTDMDRLEILLDSLKGDTFPGKADLEAELSRAKVLAPEKMPPTVVTMNSTVKFKVEFTGEKFCLTLVYPKNLGDGKEKISVLAPVGSALIGMSEGETIEWPKPGGGKLQVLIEEIVYQPERAGELHR